MLILVVLTLVRVVVTLNGGSLVLPLDTFVFMPDFQPVVLLCLLQRPLKHRVHSCQSLRL